MAVAHCTEILQARFTVFDEDNKGRLDPYELANALRSLGWTDINATHCYNLMQKFFPGGFTPKEETENDDGETRTEDENNAEEVEEETETGPCESISLPQFLSLVSKIELKPDSALECYKAYTLLDKTQTGIISTDDLTTIARTLHGNSLSDKQRDRLVRGILMAADSNHDGKLSLPEFRYGAASGGVGTENGPLDLAVLVVDQPSRNELAERKRRNNNSSKFAGTVKNLESSTSTHNNTSFSSNRRSRRGSEMVGVPYPHSNVAFTVPGAEAESTNVNNAEGDVGANDAVEDAGPATTTVTFEGIDVTFTDGMISKEQVAEFFHACGDLLVGSDFDRWFEVEDTDNDGYLTEEQFRNTLDIFLSDTVEE